MADKWYQSTMSAPARGASRTPPRRGRARSSSTPRRRPRHRDADGREVVVREVIREAGGPVTYHMLTCTNYTDWTVLMRVNLQAQGLWDAVSTGNASYRTDRQALSAILRAMPSEMFRSIASKDTAKEAWDALQTGEREIREMVMAHQTTAGGDAVEVAIVVEAAEVAIETRLGKAVVIDPVISHMSSA